MVMQRGLQGWSTARRVWWSALLVLVAIVVGFFVARLVVDVPNMVTGALPGPGAFERRYALHPIPTYLHIVPGVIYLVGAPLQLSRRFRARHLGVHRRLGRVLLTAGLLAGVLAVVDGVWFPYGGWFEASATVVFGGWFVVALVLAFRAVRGRDAVRHRRWMIRAYAIGLAVGTIRVWFGVFQLTGLLAIERNTGTDWFGVAFWLAFPMHAAAAEAYLAVRRRPGRDRSPVPIPAGSPIHQLPKGATT